MNYNPLDNERTNQEKLNEIKRKNKRGQMYETGCFILLFINILICVISLYSYMHITATTLFKIMFAFSIAGIIISVLPIIFLKGFKKIFGIITIIFNILFVIFFSISGRLKISEYIVNDGFEYAVIKGDWYLYKYSGKEANVKISSSDKYQVNKIGKNAFKNNNYVTSIEIDVLNLQFDEKAFASCNNLSDIYFINGIYTFNGKKTFDQCIQLRNVYFNNCTAKYDGYDSKKYVYHSLFEGTFNITVHQNKSSINCYPFSNDSMTLIIYKGTKSIASGGYGKVIFEEGFDFDGWQCRIASDYTCDYMLSPYGYQIYLPKSITSLPNDIFGSTSGICKIYFQGNEEVWKEFEVNCTDFYSEEKKGFLGIKTTYYYYGTNLKYIEGNVEINYNCNSEYWNSK